MTGRRMTFRMLLALAALGGSLSAPRFGGALQDARAAVTCEPALTASSAVPDQLVAANNGFGFRLFRYLLDHARAKNIFISPFSAATDLEMTMAGARGATAAAMADTLGLTGMTQESINEQAAALLARLQAADPLVQLDIADALWADKDVPFNESFLQEARHSYGAKVTKLDFHLPSAVKTMNAWVSCATHGTIPNVLKTVPPAVVLYLMNAIFFHGQWTNQFDPTKTVPSPFTRGDGSQVQVPMMGMTATLSYAARPDAQVVSLPYGSGDFDMLLILPAESTDFQQFGETLPDHWQDLTGHLQNMPVTIGLPRFTLDEHYSLVQALKALGMDQAFSDFADFSGMAPPPFLLKLSRVFQKTHLQVDEKGTTAAVVTVTATRNFGSWNNSMILDRPFFLAVRERSSGDILFLGAITDPKGT